jgi:hypothetical protein
MFQRCRSCGAQVPMPMPTYDEFARAEDSARTSLSGSSFCSACGCHINSGRGLDVNDRNGCNGPQRARFCSDACLVAYYTPEPVAVADPKKLGAHGTAAIGDGV